jgi:hypothetical protein
MPEDNSEPLNKTVKVTPSVHTALTTARRGGMTMNDVIADALRDYEPYNPDPAAALENA